MVSVKTEAFSIYLNYCELRRTSGYFNPKNIFLKLGFDLYSCIKYKPLPPNGK